MTRPGMSFTLAILILSGASTLVSAQGNGGLSAQDYVDIRQLIDSYPRVHVWPEVEWIDDPSDMPPRNLEQE